MRIVYILLMVIGLVLSGCDKAPAAVSEDAAFDPHTEQQNEDSMKVSEPETNMLTPYQLLNLGLGNAEEFYFDYTVFNHSSNEKKTGYFQKSGERFAAVFTAQDMNGNSVKVRELEMDGRVFYIMDEAKQIRSYLFPAEDFLIYELMDAAAGTENNVYEKDGFRVHEFEKPFAQDESILLNYRFFMRKGTLVKVEYSMDGQLSATYEFSKFQQEFDNELEIEKVFEYPSEYFEEWYDYQYTGENMPPWWDMGNDE